MMQRAHSGSSKDRVEYLDRGITVCERWLSFENFLADMGERRDGTTIDRIDNARGYEPGNCRWATHSEQAKNRRSSVRLTAFGTTKNVTEWAKEYGISHQALRYRLRAGLTLEHALTLPIDHANRLLSSVA